VLRNLAARMARSDIAWLQPVALIMAMWVVSDLGYYFVLPTLGVEPDYNASGVAIALYYTFWVGISIIVFWPQYATWPQHAHWSTFQNRFISALVWSIAFTAAVLFAAFVLPSLPPLDVRGGVTPPELPHASPWYFLPKSIDILFQQLLVAALVLTLAAEHISLRRISLYCAILFGAAHLLLAFGDVPWGYVVRFTVMASAFGFVFPYLLLRVPNGLAYSYISHWGYYALMIVLARLLGVGPS